MHKVLETAKSGDFKEEIEQWERVYDEMLAGVKMDHCNPGPRNDSSWNKNLSLWPSLRAHDWVQMGSVECAAMLNLKSSLPEGGAGLVLATGTAAITNCQPCVSVSL